MKKVVLITGCSSGVGLHTAITFSKENYIVYASMRDLKKSTALLEIAEKANIKVHTIELDVQKDESIKKAVDFIIQTEGHIDILVNNAGFGFNKTIEQATNEEIEDVMDVNFYGVVRMLRAVLPHMRQKKNGHVLTVSSVGGLIGQPCNEIYCAAKFAVEGLIESLATYMEPFFNVKMTLIEPAGIKSEFINRIYSDIAKKGGLKKDEFSTVLEAYLKNLQERGAFENEAQTPEQVAQVILNATKQEKTPLRVLTSKSALNFTAIKTKHDPSSQLLIEHSRKFFLGIS